MKNILNLFSKIVSIENPTEKEETADYNDRYPIALLSKYIGAMIEVYYVDMGVPQVICAQLCAGPTNESFYLSFGGAEMYINYWHRVHSDGRISAVKLIKHQGEILYKAEKVNFDELGSACYMEKERVLGPVRIVTREYLRGAFG